MSHLGSTVPYYGGGQVANPANVTQIYSDPPTFKASLGSLAVNSTAETAYIAIAEDGPGNRTVWADIFTGSSKDVFPITPYVVGPVGLAGYQTVQSALDAANAAGGGVVYMQPGTYTENLTWPLGVSLVCTAPTSFFSQVNIIGQHTIVDGNSANKQFGASNTNFFATGNLFTSSLSIVFSGYLRDCICRVNGGSAYIFNFPTVGAGSSSVFELSAVSVISGATANFGSQGVTLNVNESKLGTDGGSRLNNGGGAFTFLNSTITEAITMSGGSLGATNCTFFSSIGLTGTTSASLSLLRCDVFGDTAPAVSFEGNTSGQITECILGSSNTYAIGGNSSGIIFVYSVTFSGSSGISPFLGIATTSSFMTGILNATHTGPVALGIGYSSESNPPSVGSSPQGSIAGLTNATNSLWITTYIGATPYYFPVWAAIP